MRLFKMIKNIFTNQDIRTAARVVAAIGLRNELGLLPDIIKYMRKRKTKLSKEHQAYIIATAALETGYTYKLVEEVGGTSMPYTPFHGRGLVQLTHKGNYERMGQIFRIDLLNYRDLLLTDGNLNIRILVEGMNGGLFTGVGLDRFTDEDGNFDAINARKIVNRLDKAREIRDMYEKVLEAL